MPLFVAYGVGPVLDWWLGENENNRPEEIVPLLEDDYYRLLTMLTVRFSGPGMWRMSA